MNRNEKVWLYCRVARDDKAALENQEKRLIDFAGKKGYAIAGVSKDTGSGLTMERPGWKEVEQAITAHQVGAVLAINSSRIARNTVELLACAERLHRQGVQLVTESDGNIGKMRVAMYMRLAQEES